MKDDTRDVNPRRHGAQCKICKDGEVKALVDSLYVNRRTFREIAEEAEVSVGAVQRHVKAFPDLRKRRENNIEAIPQLIVEKGLEAIQRGELQISPTLFADSVRTLAKLRGLFVDRTLDLTAVLQGATEEELEFFEQMGRLPEKGELTKH